MSERAKSILMACAIVAMVIATYAPVARCGFIWDDDYFVVNNESLRSYEGLWNLWFRLGTVTQYYPMTFTTLWLEYRLWGLDPAGYHVVNVLLHSLGAILFWRVLMKLGIPGAWAAASLFALHPVHVESVAWIAERKNVLSGTFYFGSALAYLHCLDRSKSPASARRKPTRRPALFYGLALVLFGGALLAKSVTCSLPAVLVLIAWWKHGQIRWGDVAPLIPFFGLGLVLGLLTVWMEKEHVLAVGEEWSFSPIQRCLIAGRALWFYAGKLLWPANLAFIYPRWHIDARAMWQYVFPASALAVVLGLWLVRHRIGRGPVTALVCFAGTLFPALGFFNTYPMRYSFVADHFQYLASAAWIALVTASVFRIGTYFGHVGRRVSVAALAAVLLSFSLLSRQQVSAYTSLETLWSDTLAKNPRAWMAHNNLGLVLHEKGRFDEAMGHFRKTVELNPRFAHAYYNWGNTYFQLQRHEEAIEQYTRAVQVEPAYAKAYHNRGTLYQQLGRHGEAIESYTQAITLDPELALTYYARGNSFFQLSQFPQAIADYTKVVQIKPKYAPAYNNRAIAYARNAQFQLAWQDLLQVKQLGGTPDPNFVRIVSEKIRRPVPRAR